MNLPNIENWGTTTLKKEPKTITMRVGSQKGKTITIQPESTIKQSLWNRILASKYLGSNQSPPPARKKGGGQTRKRLTEYELRALSELSYRSPKVVTMNLKVLKSKKNRRNLRQALQQSKSKTRRRR